MPRYVYIAKSSPLKTNQGSIDAESKQDAIRKLAKMGYFPVSVESEDLSSSDKNIFHLKKTSKRDIVIFTRQLSSLIESGVNILNGLNIISQQTPNKYLRAILNDVISKIKDGRPLSDSLATYPKLFPNLYTSMLRSGEAGGTLDKTLQRLADFLEKEDEFRNSIRAALTYPAFVFSVGVLTVVVLIGFVIPKLVTMFEDMGQSLPVPTRILISLSQFMRSYWVFLLVGIAVSIFLLRRSLNSAEGKKFWDSVRLKMKIWGEVVLKTEISRLCRTMSLLLSSGIPIIASLEITSSIVENQIVKIELQKFKDQISNGLSFSQCLRESKIFPDFVINIITVGEETGTLEKSLMRIADDYERDVDRKLKALTRLLEPVIILVMGLIVGFIVISMLLPIFQINLIVK